LGSVTVTFETTSLAVDTDDLEWLKGRLAYRLPERESSALIERLDQVLGSAEPRTLALSEAEAGFVLINLEVDDLSPNMHELRAALERES